MKIGMRKPSLSKSIKARTTSKYKRKVKKAIIPGYGKKGMGWIKNPKKAAYNKVYKKTTFSVSDIFTKRVGHNQKNSHHHTNPTSQSVNFSGCLGMVATIISVILLLILAVFIITFILFLFIY